MTQAITETKFEKHIKFGLIPLTDLHNLFLKADISAGSSTCRPDCSKLQLRDLFSVKFVKIKISEC